MDKHFPFYGMKAGQLVQGQQMLMSQGIGHDGLSLGGELRVPSFIQASAGINIDWSM